MTLTEYDAGDYDTDDRVWCRRCAQWFFPGTPQEPKVCEACEERFCADCLPTHIQEEHPQ